MQIQLCHDVELLAPPVHEWDLINHRAVNSFRCLIGAISIGQDPGELCFDPGHRFPNIGLWNEVMAYPCHELCGNSCSAGSLH
jgi:hypothetical protein